MIRKIIKIDSKKCNGCGACAAACHEGAIAMIGGKARLIREDYCDGLGDCLPSCPTGAISFEERDASPYDAAAVLAEKQKKEGENLGFCPGSVPDRVETSARGGLANWPVQIKLVSSSIAFPAGTHLLIAADCTAYACGNFHDRFINGRVTLIGCPKLDGVDYSEKLAQILFHNDIASLTVVRMTVPCCGGLEHAVKKTLMICGKAIPLSVVTISADGKVTEG